jgi:hypothetical protein
MKMLSSSISRFVLSVTLVFTCCSATCCGSDLQRKPLATAKMARFDRHHRKVVPFRFFSPESFWNRRLPADASLDPNSAAIVGAFDSEIASLTEINTTRYSVPIYTVPSDQLKSRVMLVDPWRAPGGAALQSAWNAVPLPSNALPAAGTDKQLVVWQPSTDQLWEFWRLEHSSTGWRAAWGGAIKKVSSNPGTYGPEAWPGSTDLWGASASSLPIAGGLITLEDLKRGRINHALTMGIYNPRAGVYVSPAKRTDGRSREPFSLPEGAHLRLDPDLNLAELHLPRITLMIAEAAQRYGIIIGGTVAGDVTFYAQDPTPTGVEPYAGVDGYYENRSPRELLASFPWGHLQLLKMNLRKAS